MECRRQAGSAKLSAKLLEESGADAAALTCWDRTVKVGRYNAGMRMHMHMHMHVDLVAF